MSGSKQIANLRDQLTALENSPSPQPQTEATNPITAGIAGAAKVGGRAVQGIKNLFKPTLKADARAAVEINGKPVEFRLENGIWKKVDRNGNLKVASTADAEAAEAAALKDVRQHATAASPQHAAPTPAAAPGGAPGAPAAAAATAQASSLDLLNSLKQAWLRRRKYFRVGYLFLSANDVANWQNAFQNHDEEGQIKYVKKLVIDVLGIPFPFTTTAVQLAWQWYQNKLNEPFTQEDEAYVAKTVAELVKNNTPPDPNKIDARFYERIKNDYNKQKQTGAAKPTTSTAAASTPASAASTPAAAPAAAETTPADLRRNAGLPPSTPAETPPAPPQQTSGDDRQAKLARIDALLGNRN